MSTSELELSPLTSAPPGTVSMPGMAVGSRTAGSGPAMSLAAAGPGVLDAAELEDVPDELEDLDAEVFDPDAEDGADVLQ